MDDAILRTRLLELRATLKRAKLRQFESDLPDLDLDARIYTDLKLESLGPIPGDVWRYLDDSIAAAAQELEHQVSDLIAGLDAPDGGDGLVPEVAWERFRALDEQSQALFSEFVELAGGLAFRDRSNNPWIFLAADRLVQDYRVVTRDRSDSLTPLALPRVQDPFTKTLVRIIRLRFPDWTIWALPLTAYEFAFVWLGGQGPPASVRAQRIREEVAEHLQRGLDDRAVVLLSDAFAVTILGPAYAFAALHLRFDGDDLDRAHVILRTLAQLGRMRPDSEHGLYDKDVAQPLRDRWERSMLYRAALDAAQVADLESFADAALRAFRRNADTAVYGPQAWGRVRELRDHWQTQLLTRRDQDLRNAAPSASGLTVRDVLNAVWLAHITQVAADDVIAGAGEALCRHICHPARQDTRPLPAGPSPHAGGPGDTSFYDRGQGEGP